MSDPLRERARKAICLACKRGIDEAPTNEHDERDPGHDVAGVWVPCEATRAPRTTDATYDALRATVLECVKRLEDAADVSSMHIVSDALRYESAVLRRRFGLEAEEHWTCPCRYMNAGPICTHCGKPKPE